MLELLDTCPGSDALACKTVGPGWHTNRRGKTLILIIGYGNSFCGDDGVGPCAAELLAEHDIPHVQCIAIHQLTPELAAPISLADVVFFVDAAYGTTPGEI